MKHGKAVFPAKILAGKLHLDRVLVANWLSQMADCDVTVTIQNAPNRTTAAQNAYFHGVIVPTIQAFEKETTGIDKDAATVKEELKNSFLPKRKKFYSDGSPVIISVQHPEKRFAQFEWHLELCPSLSELNYSEFKSFISRVQAHYLECGLTFD